ncbi:MAG: OPT/YSL family transporter [Myxococcota bacterium]|nr:OPT/YSL family transporter [Myxococcota bacterium]
MSAEERAAAPPYRELTLSAVLIGVLIGSVMTAAFVYIALQLGFSLGGSTVAAILGFGALRGLSKQSTIIENNINQTVASGVNNASAGVTFTLPALFLMGENFSVWSALLSAIAGTFLGIVIIIPLRKQMIELERLRFPSGIAVASLLRSPGAGVRQAKLLLGGFAVAALVHVCAEVIEVSAIDFGGMISLPSYLPLVVSISFASVGAGLLAGGGGLPFVAGGFLAWWAISPAATLLGWFPEPSALAWQPDTVASAAEQAEINGGLLYGQMLRPLGIGILIGGAISGVIASFPALQSALQGLARSAKAGGGAGGAEELDLKTLIIGLISAFLLLFGAALLSAESLSVGRCLLIAAVGLLWLILAGLVVAQATGMTDISPLSGMSLIGVTLMFFLSGGDSVVAVILGVAVCVGIGQCADMMSDLKAGHLIGAQPRRQQLAQLAVAWIGVPVAIGVLYLLWGSEGGGFGPGAASGLSAPQGDALRGILDGLRSGDAPLDKYIAGGGIGLALGFHPVGGLGVLIGLAMYLPFEVTLTYAIGCFGAILLQRRLGRQWMSDTLVPVAAGFIIGEALTSIVIVILKISLGGGA